MNIYLTTTESISKLWSYMYQISEWTNMNVIYEANWKVRAALPTQHVPESELWRINLLSTFMNIKITKTLVCITWIKWKWILLLHPYVKPKIWNLITNLKYSTYNNNILSLLNWPIIWCFKNNNLKLWVSEEDNLFLFH